MGWPVEDLTKLHLDASSDDPSQARAELLALVNKVQAMLAEVTPGETIQDKSEKGVANGYCQLDSGVLVPVALIPSLAASKITTGAFADARIPSLAASKITSGTLTDARIPSLAASKITSGAFVEARIPSITQAKMIGYAVGDNSIIAANTEQTVTSSGSPTKKKEFILARGGTIRFKWDMRSSDSGSNANARIYKNGVAQGSTISTGATSYAAQSVDISGWSPNDLAQLYIWNNAATVYVRNFKMTVASVTQEVVVMD